MSDNIRNDMTVDEEANPNLMRIWDHAPQRGPGLLVLLALAKHANAQGVAEIHPDRLRSMAWLTTQDELDTHLDHLRACGDIYDLLPHDTPWRCPVATGLSSEDIVQALTDAHTFALPPEKADAIPLTLLDGQEQARQAFTRLAELGAG